MRISKDTAERIVNYLGTEAPPPMHPKYYHKAGNLSSYCDKDGDGVPAYSLDALNKLYYNSYMLNRKHKPINQTYHRNTINVVLQDGWKIKISNRAKKQKVSMSEIVRNAIKWFLGL